MKNFWTWFYTELPVYYSIMIIALVVATRFFLKYLRLSEGR